MIKTVTYNIQYGRGRDGQVDLERVAGCLAGADIVALQEVERFWARSGNCDQAAILAGFLPDHDWIFGAYFDVYGGAHGRRRQFGNLVLSRWPILASQTSVMPMHVRDRFNMRQGMVEALIDTPAGRIRFWNIHLGYLDSPERLAQLDHIGRVLDIPEAEQAAWAGDGLIYTDDWSNGDPEPAPASATVLLGDFNSRPGSKEYQRITEPRPRGLGFVDSRLLDGSQPGEPDTHPGSTPTGESGVCLDYCFVEAGCGLTCRNYRVDGEADASDHQPVWQDIVRR